VVRTGHMPDILSRGIPCNDCAPLGVIDLQTGLRLFCGASGGGGAILLPQPGAMIWVCKRFHRSKMQNNPQLRGRKCRQMFKIGPF